jgi:predicted  nucleic acid-binding Zn-ribbon protein
VSIREQIATLEELSAIDVDLRRIEDQLGKQRGSLEGMRSEVKTLEERLKADREALAMMDKTRSELNHELRQMASQIERSREKLNRSRNERESMAAQRELEELRKLHRDREEEIDRLSLAAEGARTSIADADAKLTDLKAALAGTAEGATAALVVLEAERKTRAEIRERVAGRLPSALYRRYESVRSRKPVAIARADNGTCLGCHMAVPPMMFQKMRRQEAFEICPSCHRILYYAPAETAPSADPSRA